MNQSVAQAVAQSQPVSDRGVASGMRERADPRLVLADRVEQLCSQTPIAIAASFVAGAIATVELWNKWLWMLVFFWWVLVVAFSVATTALLVGYRRTANKDASADHSLLWIGISALANRAYSGSAAQRTSPTCD